MKAPTTDTQTHTINSNSLGIHRLSMVMSGWRGLSTTPATDRGWLWLGHAPCCPGRSPRPATTSTTRKCRPYSTGKASPATGDRVPSRLYAGCEPYHVSGGSRAKPTFWPLRLIIT